MASPVGCMESVAKRRHGITRQRVFLLRIDYIPHFVMIPYRRQAADFRHAYRRDYIESYVEVLDFQGLFVFLGVKNHPFHHRTFSFLNCLVFLIDLCYNLSIKCLPVLYTE